MSTSFETMNPQLSSLKKDAIAVQEAMEEFRHLFHLEPVYLVVGPNDWRSGIKSGYLGLDVVVDPSVQHFKVKA